MAAFHLRPLTHQLLLRVFNLQVAQLLFELVLNVVEAEWLVVVGIFGDLELDFDPLSQFDGNQHQLLNGRIFSHMGIGRAGWVLEAILEFREVRLLEMQKLLLLGQVLLPQLGLIRQRPSSQKTHPHTIPVRLLHRRKAHRILLLHRTVRFSLLLLLRLSFLLLVSTLILFTLGLVVVFVVGVVSARMVESRVDLVVLVVQPFVIHVSSRVGSSTVICRPVLEVFLIFGSAAALSLLLALIGVLVVALVQLLSTRLGISLPPIVSFTEREGICCRELSIVPFHLTLPRIVSLPMSLILVVRVLVIVFLASLLVWRVFSALVASVVLAFANVPLALLTVLVLVAESRLVVGMLASLMRVVVVLVRVLVLVGSATRRPIVKVVVVVSLPPLLPFFVLLPPTLVVLLSATLARALVVVELVVGRRLRSMAESGSIVVVHSK